MDYLSPPGRDWREQAVARAWRKRADDYRTLSRGGKHGCTLAKNKSARAGRALSMFRGGRRLVGEQRAHLFERRCFDLPNALGGHAVLIGQFLQSGFRFGQPAARDDVAAALIQLR